MNDPAGHIYGKRLKLAREAASLTQDRLAELLGVSRRTLAHWEAGTKHPEFAKLQAVAEAVHQPIVYFFAEEAEPIPFEPSLADLMQEFCQLRSEVRELRKAVSEEPGRPGRLGSKAAS